MGNLGEVSVSPVSVSIHRAGKPCRLIRRSAKIFVPVSTDLSLSSSRLWTGVVPGAICICVHGGNTIGALGIHGEEKMLGLDHRAAGSVRGRMHQSLGTSIASPSSESVKVAILGCHITDGRVVVNGVETIVTVGCGGISASPGVDVARVVQLATLTIEQTYNAKISPIFLTIVVM